MITKHIFKTHLNLLPIIFTVFGVNWYSNNELKDFGNQQLRKTTHICFRFYYYMQFFRIFYMYQNCTNMQLLFYKT